MKRASCSGFRNGPALFPCLCLTGGALVLVGCSSGSGSADDIYDTDEEGTAETEAMASDSEDGADAGETTDAPDAAGETDMQETDREAEIPDDPADCILGDPGAFERPAPAPRISLDRPVFASDNVENPEGLVNGRYHDSSVNTRFGTPTPEDPRWVAIDIGEGPSRVLLEWFDITSNVYNTNSGSSPVAYHIDVSADSTDGQDGGWTPVVEVTDNTVRFRGHSFDFEGQRWVRLTLTEALPGKSVLLDEVAVHDVSAGEAIDTWAFIGDSITLGGLKRDLTEADTFDGVVRELAPDYSPAFVNLGIGGELVSDGLARIDFDLETYADYRNVGIAFGTNDSWGNKPLGSFEDQLIEMVEAVLDAGKVPILGRIPFASSGVHDTVPEFNAVIDQIQADYELPCGPDMYSWFKDHPEELSTDGVHPSRVGYQSLNRLWAEMAVALYGD